MHDDFSAYYAFKAEQPGEEKASVEGEQINKPRPSLSDDDIEESMLKVVQGAGK